MKRILTLAVIVIVVVGGGVGGYFYFTAQAAAAAANTNLSTAVVQLGTLAATVDTAGNIAASQTVGLNFQQAGVVQKVNVQVGDQVKTGQVLAELDTSTLQLQVQNAQVNLQIAQDKLAQTKNPNSAQDIASARAALAAAQANYNKLVAGPTAADTAAAQAAVTSAQAAYNAAVKAAGSQNSQLETAAAAADKARVAVQQAQAAYDKVAGDPNIGALPQSAALQQATIDYQSALSNYQTLQATVGSSAASQEAQAKATLVQAQDNLAKLQPNKDDITAAQAQVTEAQQSLDKLLAGSDANTIAIAQDGVDQAQVALKQAQMALQQAQIIAPFDGVVTAVNITDGQNSASGTSDAIQIADLNHLETVVSLSEVDVNRVKVGQDVQLTLDALPNLTLQGKVSQIAPAGVEQQGVVNYPVTVQLTNPPQSVKSGMSANLSIIVAQRTNVLMVPNRAVKTAAPGSALTFAASTTPTGGQGAANGNQSGAAASTPAGNASGRQNGNGAGGGSRSGANGGQNGSANGASGSSATRRPTQVQYVTILKNGQQVQVQVRTGLSSDTMTEIVSGLNEGDVVVLNPTATTQTGRGGFGFPGVGRFGG